ncbi:MAG: flagellar basal-body rod protein FlgF [Alphaproteobacteria bacterium]|nr:flagellar basal-body rod protein FlgF [Alphaproteobacteria bacterium]
MENSLYLGLSRQMVLRTNMEIIANNVANMNTPGYRGQNLVFSEFLAEPKGQIDPKGAGEAMSYVHDTMQYEITEPGPVQVTSNPLDVAVDGPGFIGVQGPGNKPAYTRGGNFQMDSNGTLLTAAGYPVSSMGGGGITIPEGSTEIKIDYKGIVSNQDGQIGQIKLVEFDNLQVLKPEGNGLYTTDAASRAPQTSRLRQGALEGSNVKPVLEMTRMIDTLRNYQSTQQILQAENDRLRTAIRELSKT